MKILRLYLIKGHQFFSRLTYGNDRVMVHLNHHHHHHHQSYHHFPCRHQYHYYRRRHHHRSHHQTKCGGQDAAQLSAGHSHPHIWIKNQSYSFIPSVSWAVETGGAYPCPAQTKADIQLEDLV